MPSVMPESTSSLTVADHLNPYQAPPAIYLAQDGSDIPNSRLVASAAVIRSKHVLLLQRAAHSFQPLLWELPGGRCEARDESVIASAARELWEETGIVAREVVDVVGKYEWLDHGETWRKITFKFLVEVEDEEQGDDRLPQVTIDPKEQAGFIWATEEDVIADRCGEVSLSWTSEEQKQTVLKAFKLV